jgi:hypothetical protein
MHPTESNQPDETTEAKPMQVGTQPGEVERLRGEISQSGVANSEADVERLGIEGPETGEDDSTGGPSGLSPATAPLGVD